MDHCQICGAAISNGASDCAKCGAVLEGGSFIAEMGNASPSVSPGVLKLLFGFLLIGWVLLFYSYAFSATAHGRKELSVLIEWPIAALQVAYPIVYFGSLFSSNRKIVLLPGWVLLLQLLGIFIILTGSSMQNESLKGSLAMDIKSEVRDKGPRVVVEEIWRSESKRKQFLSGVGSAQPEWIDAAKAVYTGADAEAAELLNEALAQALLKEPYLLLPWLKAIWWENSPNICIFGTDSELPAGTVRFLDNLERTIFSKAPKSMEAANLQRDCLRGINKTRAAIANHSK